MRYNNLAPSKLQVSELCLGRMTWGEQNSEAEAHQQIDYALSRGINFIDAAQMYPVPPRARNARARAIESGIVAQEQEWPRSPRRRDQDHCPVPQGPRRGAHHTLEAIEAIYERLPNPAI